MLVMPREIQKFQGICFMLSMRKGYSSSYSTAHSSSIYKTRSSATTNAILFCLFSAAANSFFIYNVAALSPCLWPSNIARKLSWLLGICTAGQSYTMISSPRISCSTAKDTCNSVKLKMRNFVMFFLVCCCFQLCHTPGCFFGSNALVCCLFFVPT